MAGFVIYLFAIFSDFLFPFLFFSLFSLPICPALSVFFSFSFFPVHVDLFWH